jgi:hypothetical protein
MQLTANAGGSIELWIANAPQANLDGIPSGVGGRHEAVDPHFKHYYDYFKPYLLDQGKKRYSPVAAGVCIQVNGISSFSSDPCDLYHAVKIPKPAQCRQGPALGDVNCGPDGIP